MCGIVGAYNIPGAAAVAERGLEAVVNRGQDYTGIAILDAQQQQFAFEGGEGTPQRIYDLEAIAQYGGSVALGENRYTTNGDHGRVQPTDENNNTFTLVHNGNLSHPHLLQEALSEAGVDITGANDSKQISLYMGWRMANGATLEQAAEDTYWLIRDAGSFCILAADATTGKMVALRDRRGIRPMAVAKQGDGYVVASETTGLQAMGVNCTVENENDAWRNVEPAEMLVFSEGRMDSRQLEESRNELAADEFIYLANERSILYGRVVHDVRRDLGRELAIEHPVKDGIVVPVPNTAIPFAEGFAGQSGRPLVKAITIPKKLQGTRSFMLPVEQRATGAEKKLKVAWWRTFWRKLNVIDDSVFRGTVQRANTAKLRKTRARTIRAFIGSPQVRWANNLGTATKGHELIARGGKPDEKIAAEIGVDHIGFLSIAGMYRGIKPPPGYGLTAPDFTGENPIDMYWEANQASETTTVAA